MAFLVRFLPERIFFRPTVNRKIELTARRRKKDMAHPKWIGPEAFWVI